MSVWKCIFTAWLTGNLNSGANGLAWVNGVIPFIPLSKWHLLKLYMASGLHDWHFLGPYRQINILFIDKFLQETHNMDQNLRENLAQARTR